MSINVLIVDDQIGMIETFTDILEDKGFNVSTSEDGYQAIKKVKEKPFDVIFMDIKMPGINGVQTYREIKKINPNIAVIMMTAYSVEDLIKEAIEEGAYAVVYKPFEIEKIIKIIEKALKKVLVLIVDDRMEDRETFKDIVESKGYKAYTAKDGYEAIEKVKEEKFDIIFIDIKMPEMDGLKTFEIIHQISPEIPVVMVTGYSAEDLVREAFDKGAYTCIYKPFDIEGILKILEEVLAKKSKNQG